MDNKTNAVIGIVLLVLISGGFIFSMSTTYGYVYLDSEAFRSCMISKTQQETAGYQCSDCTDSDNDGLYSLYCDSAPSHDPFSVTWTCPGGTLPYTSNTCSDNYACCIGTETFNLMAFYCSLDEGGNCYNSCTSDACTYAEEESDCDLGEMKCEMNYLYKCVDTSTFQGWQLDQICSQNSGVCKESSNTYAYCDFPQGYCKDTSGCFKCYSSIQYSTRDECEATITTPGAQNTCDVLYPVDYSNMMTQLIAANYMGVWQNFYNTFANPLCKATLPFFEKVAAFFNYLVIGIMILLVYLIFLRKKNDSKRRRR